MANDEELKFLIFRPMVGSLPGKTPNFLKIIIFIRGNDVLKPGLKTVSGVLLEPSYNAMKLLLNHNVNL